MKKINTIAIQIIFTFLIIVIASCGNHKQFSLESKGKALIKCGTMMSLFAIFDPNSIDTKGEAMEVADGLVTVGVALNARNSGNATRVEYERLVENAFIELKTDYKNDPNIESTYIDCLCWLENVENIFKRVGFDSFNSSADYKKHFESLRGPSSIQGNSIKHNLSIRQLDNMQESMKMWRQNGFEIPH